MEERAEPKAPIQFALAGMNAHINNDLALAVVQTCEELGLEPADDSPQHADYERVNAILKNVETRVSGWFTNGLIADIEDVVPSQVDKALAMWSIVTARELAWEHAQMIWRLRELRAVKDSYIDVLGRTTELAGRAMLV
jgi:hypothetical protein